MSVDAVGSVLTICSSYASVLIVVSCRSGASGDGDAAFVTAYDDMLQEFLTPVMNLGTQLGGDIVNMTTAAEKALKAQRAMLLCARLGPAVFLFARP